MDTASKKTNKRWFNGTEAAEYIGFNAATMSTWRKNRKGPKYQRYDGGTIRYDRADLDDFIVKHTHGK